MPRTGSGQVKKVCAVCGSPFESWPSWKRQCCTRECADIKHSQDLRRKYNRDPESHPMIGRKQSKEWTQKRVNAGKGKVGRKPGFHHSDEWRAMMSRRFSLSGGPGWKGGISLLPYAPYKHLRKAILLRDGHHCRLCGCEGPLVIHHIDYDKLNNKLRNLCFLCRRCNSRVNHGRDGWRRKLEADK